MGYGGLQDAPTFFPATGSARSPAKARTTTRTGGRAKRACKYGPRDADGYCPKKPRSSRSRSSSRSSEELGELGTYEPPKPKAAKPRKRTRAERLAETRAINAVERAARRTVVTGITKAAKSRTGERITTGAAALGAYLKSPVSKVLTAGSASAAGAVGLSIAAGLASYGATTAILRGIKNRKERRQQAAFEAAQAMRTARLDAQARLGRPLTIPENQRLAQAFNLPELMRKAGL